MDADQRWGLLRLNVEDEIPLTEIARTSGIGLRTLQRWKANFHAHGYAGLARDPRSDQGTRRLDHVLVKQIEDLGLAKPRASVATIHRVITKIAREQGTVPPSYSTVRNIVTALDPGLRTLALEGPTAYRDKYELAMRRRATTPNAMWQSDHTMLDILIRGTDGKPVRPWLTIVEDDYSRAVCGYAVFTGAPSAMNTALALRQAIWHKSDPQWAMCGIPDVLYVDHGTDFTSSHVARSAIDLYIRIVHSAVARPQGRGKIERFYGTINTELLPALGGHLAPGQRHPEPVLNLSQLDQAVGRFILEYNHRTHRSIGVSPHQAWIGDGWLPRMPQNLTDLDGFLLHVARERTVQRDGIHFEGLRYLSPTLASYVGTRVAIRYDPRDISEIRVFDHDTYICTAIDEEHANTVFSLKDVQAARNARRRALRTRLNERIPIATAVPTPPTPEPGPPPRPKLRTYAEDAP